MDQAERLVLSTEMLKNAEKRNKKQNSHFEAAFLVRWGHGDRTIEKDLIG